MLHLFDSAVVTCFTELLFFFILPPAKCWKDIIKGEKEFKRPPLIH